MRNTGDALTVVITGGAGFVGSSLAIGLKSRHPEWTISAFDNLKRAGSELSLARLHEAAVRFVHGDVRRKSELAAVGSFDVLIACTSEPSIPASRASPSGVETELVGILNCLETVRENAAGIVFLSSSRVYPIATIERLPYRERAQRFELESDVSVPGYSGRGIAEDFPLAGVRSLYGAAKLCSELIIQEYAEAYEIPAVIDRCGVLAGPFQTGKVEQGFVMHWVASHVLRRPLRYVGYGGQGKQVRDILHVGDLVELIYAQLSELPSLRGDVFNIGGGYDCSVSLRELTQLCERATGRRVEIVCEPETRPSDLRIYVSDCEKAGRRFSFMPKASPEVIVDDIARWVADHRAVVERTLFGT